jgi:hypothetical protein
MLNLKSCTFLIPIKIEHPDRYRNAKTTLEFINHHFDTNVFIYETSEDGLSKLDFLESLKNLNIKKWTIGSESFFHRTKYLNIMLDSVETEVAINYDIDVILSAQNYIKCQQMILDDEYDVIYPYLFGVGQKKIYPNINLEDFKKSGFDTSYIDDRPDIFNIGGSEYGHCVFFRTSIYRKYGGENENFISYGPEDKERGERFTRLGTRVRWNNDYFVYHFEHYRGNDSSNKNQYFIHNQNVHKQMNRMCEEDFQKYEEYYRNPEYSNKYKTIGKN